MNAMTTPEALHFSKVSRQHAEAKRYLISTVTCYIRHGYFRRKNNRAGRHNDVEVATYLGQMLRSRDAL